MYDLMEVYAIERLAITYASAANRRDYHAMSETFTDDGRLVGMARMVGLDQDAITGRESIFQFFSNALAPVEYVYQNAQLGPVDFSGDQATAQVMLTEFVRWPGQTLSIFLGCYHDTCRRTDTGWRYLERRLVPSAIFQPSGTFAPL